MSSCVVLPMLITVLLIGCGKSPGSAEKSPVSTTEPAQGVKTEAAPATKQTDATLSNASEAALSAALMELTQALRRYSFEHQRVPKTIGEVVAAGYLKNMPQAPPGKKFAIEAKKVQVVLVNQ
jgi:competence protein ComGC